MADARRVGDAVDRALLGAHGAAGDRLDHLARAFGVVDPLRVEVVGAGGHALVALAGVDLAGVAAVQQLEQVVLRLAVAAEVADLLKKRGETVALSESSMGGLVSAALVAQPGASAFYLGSTVIYTRGAARALYAL